MQFDERQEAFTRLDADGDGSIGLQEVMEGPTRIRSSTDPKAVVVWALFDVQYGPGTGRRCRGR
ncbi:hypothetical protein AB0890_01865 [Streptomyces sp. NPDC005406]|uniref:hypothetical protein n=1 Tax=Streptomyces sp. NPDC005406 TaxID=3155339 RepID=UPI0034530781